MDSASIKKYVPWSIAGILAVICIVLCCMTTCTRQQNKNLANNIKALTDTVQVVKLKNGDLLYEKQSLILEKKDLENYLDVSNKKVSELENKLNSKIEYIALLEGNVRIDSILCVDTVYSVDPNKYKVEFQYIDDWTSLKGSTIIELRNTAQTTIYDLQENVPLTVGFDKDYKCFVTTDNPNVTFTNINSAAINSQIKPKRWGIGPTLTVGAGYGFATDFKGNQVSGGMIVGAMVGFSLHYDILQW